MDIQKTKKAIDACDVVSFDIFDTLVLRLCARAEDIFRIVEHKTGIKGFAKAREQMQRLCSLEVEKKRGEPHCTYDDIYEYMRTHASLDMKGFSWGRLRKAELDAEKFMLVQNTSVYELYCYAKSTGKRVIAVSDMYLGEKEILPLLEKCGYTAIDKLYISADVKKTKYRMDIYGHVCQSEGMAADRILHIGDSVKDDFENARECGLNAILYDGVRNKRKMPLYLSVCTGVSCMLRNRDNSFWYALGTRVGGALYCGLARRFMCEVGRVKPHKIFFLSRDGFNLFEIIKRLGEIACDMEYFCASRRSLLLCGMDKPDSEARALLPPFTFGQSVGDILAYLDMSDIDEKYVRAAGFTGLDDTIKKLDDFERFRDIFNLNTEYFAQKAAQERGSFAAYLDKLGYCEDSLIFDAGWNGSSQFLLDRALTRLGYSESRFAYAGLSDSRKRRRQLADKKYSALLFDAQRDKKLYARLKQSIVILELFFGAPHAAVWKYAKDGVLYENDDREQCKAEILRGIADCVEKSYPMLRRLDLYGTAQECLAPVLRLIEHPTAEEAVRIGDLENADGFVTRRGVKKYIARLEPADLTPELNEFYWPQGIYARPDISEDVKKFVAGKTGVKMPKIKKTQKKQQPVRPNVFVRVGGYVRGYGLAATARMIMRRLGAKTGSKAYKAHIAAAEADISRTVPLDYRPLFSFVVPVYNVEEKILRECIESVLAQTYTNYELILVDDCSTLPDVARVLEEYKNSPRVMVICRGENGHISRCTNTGIDAAKGEYIVFMDCDDTVAPNAVYEFTRVVNADRDADLIYSDEDKLNEKGERYMPHFKPDWSPDTLMSLMYTGHLSAYRTSIVRELGGLRPKYDGAQDYDLTLRFTERTNRVRHIPKVLYHWRCREGSIAAAMSEKPYVMQAVRALKKDALSRRGIRGSVVQVPEVHQYRVVYAAPENALVSIIIPSKDNFAVLERCINSLTQKTEYKNYEIVLVDNGSTTENRFKYAALCESVGGRYIYKKSGFNFSKMCNDGAAGAKGDYLLFLNDDTEIVDGSWLGIMLGQAALVHTGAVGAKLLYPDGVTIQHCGVLNLPIGPCHALTPFDDRQLYYFGRNRLDYNYIAVTAACLMVSAKKFKSVGGFDESFGVAYNDIDLCFRLYEAGWYNCVRTDAVLYHHESVSRGHDEQSAEKTRRLMREMRALYEKHPRFDAADPFYNPNLVPDRADFGVDGNAKKSPVLREGMDIAPFIGGDINAGIDMVNGSEKIYVRGWAFIGGMPSNPLTVCRLLLIDNDNKAFVLKTKAMLRRDVGAGRKDGSMSGFECAFDTADIAKGSYRLGIMLVSVGKKYVYVTDRTLNIPAM